MAEKAEFAGREWVALAREYLEKRVAQAGDKLDGVDFALCEVFTDPPAHLLRGDDNRVAWWVRISGSNVEVGDREIDIERKLTVDYQEVLPFAKTVYEGNPEAQAAAQERMRQRVESGAADRSFLEMPQAVTETLGPIHDHLARLTL